MCVSFLKNPTPSVSVSSDVEELSNGKGKQDWMLGCFYLLTGVIIFTCNTVLQAAAQKRFPAPPQPSQAGGPCPPTHCRQRSSPRGASRGSPLPGSGIGFGWPHARFSGQGRLPLTLRLVYLCVLRVCNYHFDIVAK